MLKEHSSFIKQMMAVIDCLLITLSFFTSYFIVSKIKYLSSSSDYLVILIGFMLFYLYFAWTRSLFSILQFSWMKNLPSRIIAIFISAGILGAAILYMLPDRYNSRTLYLVFTFVSFVFIAIEKMAFKYLFAWLRKNNRNTTPILFFGRGRIASQLAEEINIHPEWGLRIAGKLDLNISPNEFEEILRDSYVEEVFFAIPRSQSIRNFRIDSYLHICEEMGRPARVFLNLSSATRFARWEYHSFMDRPSLISHTVELDPDQLLFKRIFDIIGGIIGVSILVLMYPILAVIIKLTSKGPVFFKQVRVGRHGKRFLIYKFRTMTVDAEDRKKDLEKENEMSGQMFKMKNDPRVTSVGKILRKLSIDEFPQFINVLKGEMSLVGTRPPTPNEVSKYQKWHHRRISTRPGITGLWQVSGRSSIKDFDEIVKLDLKYIDTWSIWQDIIIIIKTVLVLFKRDEAF